MRTLTRHTETTKPVKKRSDPAKFDTVNIFLEISKREKKCLGTQCKKISW